MQFFEGNLVPITITWQAIADRIGINVVTLWRWRNRPGGPTPEQEERIRQAVRSILQEGARQP